MTQQFLEMHGWPIAIWGTVEKTGKNDFGGKVSFWALIARTYRKQDGSLGTQKMLVTGGDRSGLGEAREGLAVICSAVYKESKDKSGVWKARPWVTSTTVLPIGAPLPQCPPQSYPPAQTQPASQAPYQQQQYTPQMPPPNAQHHQTGLYHQHNEIPF